MVQVKLRSFYLWYINRAFQFNYIRAKYTKDLSPNCSLCGLHNEVFIHLFWECSKVQPMWTRLIAWCKENVFDTVTYSKEKCLLLGFELPVLNMIMTICKYHIFLAKFQRSAMDFPLLLCRINQTRVRDWIAYRVVIPEVCYY